MSDKKVRRQDKTADENDKKIKGGAERDERVEEKEQVHFPI